MRVKSSFVKGGGRGYRAGRPATRAGLVAPVVALAIGGQTVRLPTDTRGQRPHDGETAVYSTALGSRLGSLVGSGRFPVRLLGSDP
jgi:hypothetical protein